MHSKTPTLWYHKIKFNISKSIFDTTKWILWYQKINLIFLYKKKMDFVIYIKKCDTKKPPWFSDITNSIFWYHKIIFFFFIKNSGWFGDITKSFMWYQKIIFVISQVKVIFNIKTSILWYHKVCRILNRRNDDSSVLPMLFFLYSRRYKISSMRINCYWVLSLFQRTERQKRFLLSHNRFIYITKS